MCCIVLFLCLVPQLRPLYGDPATAAVRTELQDLREIQTRLMIDYPRGRYSLIRLLYVENRSGADPVLRPERMALGISSPLLTAGPLRLEGILAELYNPLAHGPKSDVFSRAADLALDIDLDVGSRSGLELSLIPEHWSVFGIHKETVGVQVGSVAVIALGPGMACELVGMLSEAEGRAEEDEDGSWYNEEAPFPGGLLSHVAGAMIFDRRGLNLNVQAALSGGKRIGPGLSGTVLTAWTGSRTELALLIGYCSPGFVTPEGQGTDLEWNAAARMQWARTPVELIGEYRKEIARPRLLGAAFRESRDRFAAQGKLCRRIGPSCFLDIESEGEVELVWPSSGTLQEEYELDARGTLGWKRRDRQGGQRREQWLDRQRGQRRDQWRVSLGVNQTWGSEIKGLGEVGIGVACDSSWGEIDVELEYQSCPMPGWYLDATADLGKNDTRVYLRVNSRKAVPCPAAAAESHKAEFLELFSISLGWQAESRLIRRTSLRAAGPTEAVSRFD
jgi:hypothetical protein